jgi:hexaprenyl-diphosphate synthase
MLSSAGRSAVRASRRSSRFPLSLAPAHIPAIGPSLSRPKSTDPRASWAAATESAHSVLTPPPASQPAFDPLSAIHAEISTLKDSLFRLLGSSHPSLDTIAKYYFHTEGKHLRPLLVLLMSQATNGLAGAGWDRVREEARYASVDDSLTTEGGVLNDWNPEVSGPEGSANSTTFAEPFRIPNLAPPPPMLAEPIAPLPTSPDDSTPQILPTQRRLASITEMIHVASLLHDDVIDASPLRRGQPSASSAFGNKLSILSGDFLLGRASIALARLGSREVVELLATVIANLVEGEVMQLRATSEPEHEPTRKGFEDYMRKTYLKTASLMAKSARAAVILGGSGRGVGADEGEWVKDVAYGYGRNLGIAFQVSRTLRRLQGPVCLVLVPFFTSPERTLTRAARGRCPRLPPRARSRQARRRRRPQARPRDRPCPFRMGRRA